MQGAFPINSAVFDEDNLPPCDVLNRILERCVKQDWNVESWGLKTVNSAELNPHCAPG